MSTQQKDQKKQKIVHVISSLSIGGAETILAQLAQGLSGEFEQEIICFYDGPIGAQLRAQGFQVHCCKSLFFMYDPLFLWRFLNLIRHTNPSVIHACLWAASFLSRCIGWFLKIPVISSVHAEPSVAGTLRNCIERLAPPAFCTIGVSCAVIDQLVEKKIVSRDRTIVINNGIDHDLLLSQAKDHSINRSDLQLHEHDFVIGTVGRLVSVKNHSFLLEVLRSLLLWHAHVRLVVVGFGPLEYALKKEARKFGVEDYVRFVTDQQPAYRYYKTFDYFVLTSYSEGFSLALVEAMSLSIASRALVGNAERLRKVFNGTDVVYPLGSAYDCAVEIGDIVERRENKFNCIIKNRDFVVKNFNSKTMANSYAAVFRQFFK